MKYILCGGEEFANSVLGSYTEYNVICFRITACSHAFIFYTRSTQLISNWKMGCISYTACFVFTQRTYLRYLTGANMYLNFFVSHIIHNTFFFSMSAFEHYITHTWVGTQSENTKRVKKRRFSFFPTSTYVQNV